MKRKLYTVAEWRWMGIWNDCSKDGALGFGELSWEHHEPLRQTRFRLSEDSALREMVRMYKKSLLSRKKVRIQDFGKSFNGRFGGGGEGIHPGIEFSTTRKVLTTTKAYCLLYRILYLRQRRET